MIKLTAKETIQVITECHFKGMNSCEIFRRLTEMDNHAPLHQIVRIGVLVQKWETNFLGEV